MRNPSVTAVSVPTEQITINRNEAAVRLKIPRGYTSESLVRCEKRLRETLSCKYAFIKTPVAFKAENVCDLGFGALESYDLAKALDGCREAYLLGVTIGIGADRLIARLGLTDPAESFITDAFASAAAESLCDYADRVLRGTGKKPFRFSPGYGDLPLSCQPAVLAALNADYTLGITLNDSLLMTPMKSVTAIMGISATDKF